MGSLSELISNTDPSRQHPLDRILDELDDEDREALLRVLKDPAWRAKDLAALLRKVGCEVTYQNITAWRVHHGYAR